MAELLDELTALLEELRALLGELAALLDELTALLDELTALLEKLAALLEELTTACFNSELTWTNGNEIRVFSVILGLVYVMWLAVFKTWALVKCLDIS